jgi:hypothetical protein
MMSYPLDFNRRYMAADIYVLLSLSSVAKRTHSNYEYYSIGFSEIRRLLSKGTIQQQVMILPA